MEFHACKWSRMWVTVSWTSFGDKKSTLGDFCLLISRRECWQLGRSGNGKTKVLFDFEQKLYLASWSVSKVDTEFLCTLLIWWLWKLYNYCVSYLKGSPKMFAVLNLSASLKSLSKSYCDQRSQTWVWSVLKWSCHVVHATEIKLRKKYQLSLENKCL